MNFMNKSKNNKLIDNRFKIIKKIGSGNFGEVFLAEDINTREQVAIKTEQLKARPSLLPLEAKVFRALNSTADVEGIPKMYFFGKMKGAKCLVQTLLGKDLNTLAAKRRTKKFSILTTLILAQELIARMEYIHKKNFIHRDIKPDNFMIGEKDPREIFLIDFGLSRRFRHPKKKTHAKYTEGKPLIGTPRYASINNHLGVDQSRRDDMESVGYVLIFLALGRLPWQGIKVKKHQEHDPKIKYNLICKKKMEVSVEKLCRDLPRCFELYVQYTRSLYYMDKPNYPYLKTLFKDEIGRMVAAGEVTEDEIDYDWIKDNQRMANVNVAQLEGIREEREEENLAARRRFINSHMSRNFVL
eukprot:maker-scaffold_6-snap-gene-14.50-mRNA-1 protein AED:0.01 eAED:0.01 QI:142/1/1/1/1/1/2/107/355